MRRAADARRAEAEATEAGFDDVLVTVQGEVARNYFELRGAQTRVAVARETARSHEETLRLTQARVSEGLGSALDTERVTAQLETSRAAIPPLEATAAQAGYRLAVLTGRQPHALSDLLTAPARLTTVLAAAAPGTPAELLVRRPDVRRAERLLAAATDRAGAAAADLYPRLTVTGTIGVQTRQVGDAAGGGAVAWAFGPRVAWAAFDMWRVRARIRAAEAGVVAEQARYEQAVLTALEDVDGALVRAAKEADSVGRLEAAETARCSAARHTRLRHREGLTSRLDVLDAERRVFDVQDQLAESRTRLATAAVAVFKALGGGWEEGQPPLTDRGGRSG